MDPLIASFISQPAGDVTGVCEIAAAILHKHAAEPAWLADVVPHCGAATLEKCARTLVPLCSRSSATDATDNFQLIEKILLVVAVLCECATTLPMLVDTRLCSGRFLQDAALPHVLNILLDPAPEVDKLASYAASHLLKVIREIARIAPPELAVAALPPPLLHFAAHALALFGGEDPRKHEGLLKAVEARNALVVCSSCAVRSGYITALTRVARESVFTAAGAASVLDAFVHSLAPPPPDSMTAEGVLDVLRAGQALAASFPASQDVQVLFFWSVANALCDASRPLTRAARAAFAHAAPLWREICAAVASALRRWPSSRMVLLQSARALIFNVTNARGVGYLGALAAIEAGVLTGTAAALPLHADDAQVLQSALGLLVELTRSQRAVAVLPDELVAGICALLERCAAPGSKLPPDSLIALIGSVLSHYRATDYSDDGRAGHDVQVGAATSDETVPATVKSRAHTLARPLELLEAVMARIADADDHAGPDNARVFLPLTGPDVTR